MLISNTYGITTKPTTDIINKEIMFNKNPARTMSLIFIFPLPKMTALGGVAIGSMKAQLAAIVAGITKNKGFWFIPIAKIIKIGEKVAIVAVFEFNSVKKIITPTAKIINIKRS